MADSVTKMIAAWQVELVYGWSIMDIVGLMIVLIFTANIINYFYSKGTQ
jgi:hypothetical protein